MRDPNITADSIWPEAEQNLRFSNLVINTKKDIYPKHNWYPFTQTREENTVLKSRTLL